MPSETTRVGLPDAVMEALAGPRDAYHSALVSSAEELRGMLSEAEGSDDDRSGRLAAELGPFASGRVDAGRLATLLSKPTVLAPGSSRVVRRAAEALEGMLEGGDDAPVVVEVARDGDLRDAVRDALAGVGRAFGAARAAELARTGSFDEKRHESLFDGLPYRSWTTAERQLAPPLVVRVAGADLRPAGLADFLEGGLKIVLLVEGEAPPAALARLVIPGVLVLQAIDAAGVMPLADFPGPAVAALFEGAAAAAGGGADGVVEFLHDPRRGVLPWKRIELKADVESLRTLLEEKKWRTRSWRTDLEHLVALATPPTTEGDTAPSGDGTSGGEEGPEAVGDVDRLAAWLLAKTDLEDL